MIKQSEFPTTKILGALGIGAGITAGAAGLGYLLDLTKKHGRKTKLPVYFQNMLLKNQDINELYMSSKESKAQVEDLFALLEDFAPKIVENPLASGTFIRQLLKYSDLGPNTETIETLSKITKNYSDSSGTGYGGSSIGRFFEQVPGTGLSIGQNSIQKSDWLDN